jgi:N-acetyl-D-muramate 6-phosphate phosphatase
MKETIQTVLFDLDGTLLDTAPDLVYTLNLVRQEHGLPEVPVSFIHPIANLGAQAMLMKAFDMKEKDPRLPKLRERFFELYHQNLIRSTQLFPHMDKVLKHLDERYIPWGIVTNRLTALTHSLLEGLGLADRPHSIVCGDSLSRAKPYPDTILYACKELKQDPRHCLYVGDASTDVVASKAAGSKSLVALYGYINPKDDPYSWQADGYVHEPVEIIEWLQK